MGSLLAFFSLFSLVLFVNTIDARPDSGEYWQGIMKDQPMPEAIQGLIHRGTMSSLSTTKTDCHTTTEAKNNDKMVKDSAEEEGEKKPFVKDFEPRPNVSAYSDGTKLTGAKSFVKDFEPRPNVSVYDDDVGLKGEKKSFDKDFEPRPNVSVYNE